MIKQWLFRWHERRNIRKIALEPDNKTREVLIGNNLILWINKIRLLGVDDNSIDQGLEFAIKRFRKFRFEKSKAEIMKKRLDKL